MLYTWIDDTIEVDLTVAGLYEEVKTLSSVLESVAKAANQIASSLGTAGVEPDGDLWGLVKTLLDDIKSTLSRLAGLLGEVQKVGGSALTRGVLRRPVKLMRLKLKLKELTAFRERIRSYNAAMNSALQMINV